jgi:hypothetical protein
MQKLDFKKRDKLLYSGKQGRWDRLLVPPMTYAAISGQGDPDGSVYGRAVAALYPVAYGVKALFKAKAADFVVPPMSTLWSGDDATAFVTGDRETWQWTAMIRLPDETNADQFQTARDSALQKLARKKDAATDAATMGAVNLKHLDEGECLQTLHVGPYADEAPVLADLHENVMPGLNLTFGGAHHEVYLSDPRRVAPQMLRTILRQPVIAA